MAGNVKGAAPAAMKNGNAASRPLRRVLKHCLLDDCSGSVGTDVTANRAGTEGLLAPRCRLRPGQPRGRTGRECRHNTFSLPRGAGAATKFGECGGEIACDDRLETGEIRRARALLAERSAGVTGGRKWTRALRRFGLAADAKK